MSDESSESKSPFTIWWVASGVLVAFVVTALVLVLAFGQGGDARVPAAIAPNPAGNAAAKDDAPTSKVTCDLPAKNQDIPVSAPTTTWKPDQYFLVPTSNEFGPVAKEDSAWACFAHSPTGALFAAANFFDRTAGQDYENVTKEGAVENAARDAWLTKQERVEHKQSAGRVAQIAGFQYLSVQPDSVIVSLVFRQSPITASLKIALVWSESEKTWLVDFAASALKPEVAQERAWTAWEAGHGQR